MQAANPYDAPAAALESAQKLCESCGVAIERPALTCPACGARQRKMVSKPALLLLTFFLGGVGAHKLYVGHWVQGIFYLLLAWTWIPALIALIEFIVYACTSSERLNQRYSARASAGLVAAVMIAVVVLILGVLAAIAIPAYEDYNLRSKLSEAVYEMGEYKSAVSDYYADRQQLPVTGAEVTPPAAPAGASERPRYTSAIRIARGGVVVGVLAGNVDKKLTGQAIMLVPRAKGPDLTWDCGVQSEAMLRFVRMDCRSVMPLP